MHRATVQAHTENVVGALVHMLYDDVITAVQEAAGRSTTDATALVVLTNSLDGKSQRQLGQALGLSQSATVRLVDRLATAKLIRRGAGPDARTVAVELTDRGRSHGERAMNARTHAIRGVLDALTPEDIEQLGRLVDRLVATTVDPHTNPSRMCRLCDPEACGHWQGKCPITNAVQSLTSTPESEPSAHKGARA